MLNFVRQHGTLTAIVFLVLVGLGLLLISETSIIPSISGIKSDCLKSVSDEQNKSQYDRDHSDHLIAPRDIPKTNPPSSNGNAGEHQVEYDCLVARYTQIIARLTLWLVWATSLLGLATFIAAFAAKAAADHIPRLERSYLFLNTPTIFFSTDFFYREDPVNVPVQFFFINHGKTPAVISYIEAHFEFLTLAPDSSILRGVNQIDSEIILAAGDKTDRIRRSLSHSLESAARKDLEEGRSHLWFHGTVRYQDIFGSEHRTSFRWRYDRHIDWWGPDGGPPFNERT